MWVIRAILTLFFSATSTGRLVVEVMRPRSQRTLPARSPGSDRPAGHRLVPLERLGLHPQEGHHDDQTARTAGSGSAADCGGSGSGGNDGVISRRTSSKWRSVFGSIALKNSRVFCTNSFLFLLFTIFCFIIVRHKQTKKTVTWKTKMFPGTLDET